VRLHEVENPLLGVIKHADLGGMEEVGLWDVAHDTGKMSKHVECSVNMSRREVGIGHHGVAIAERSIEVVIPPGGVHCQQGHTLDFRCLYTRTSNTHVTRDHVGRCTQGNLQAMLRKPVCKT